MAILLELVDEGKDKNNVLEVEKLTLAALEKKTLEGDKL